MGVIRGSIPQSEKSRPRRGRLDRSKSPRSQPLRQVLINALRSLPFGALSNDSLLQAFIFACCFVLPSALAAALASGLASALATGVSFSHFFTKLALAAPASFFSAALASQPEAGAGAGAGTTSAGLASGFAGAAAAGLASGWAAGAGAPWARATLTANNEARAAM